jgi:glycosyltransferase involved in cell wall biosynthesis
LLARALGNDPGLEQRLLTRRGSELARRATQDGVAVRNVPWAMGLDPRAWWYVLRECRDFQPDIIHAHNSHALALAVWARMAFARGGGGGGGGRRQPPPHLLVTRRVVFPVRPGSALFRADRIIAISEAVRVALVTAGVAPARIALVPSGIDPDDVRRAATFPLGIRAQLGLPSATPLAANIAALEHAKDQTTLIRAAAHARTYRPELHWVIAGAGPLRSALAAEARKLGVTDRIHFIGWTDHPEALMREADVIVMSSRAEGLGTAALDAMALAKPVVATSGGGLSEIVPAQWLVGVGDWAALAQKVVRALDHPSRFPLPPQYTAAAMAQGVLAAYTSVLDSTRLQAS